MINRNGTPPFCNMHPACCDASHKPHIVHPASRRPFIDYPIIMPPNSSIRGQLRKTKKSHGNQEGGMLPRGGDDCLHSSFCTLQATDAELRRPKLRMPKLRIPKLRMSKLRIHEAYTSHCNHCRGKSCGCAHCEALGSRFG